MKFDLVDCVLEQQEGRIVTVKQVTAAEEYLGDHFPGFPVLPGVLMLESMVQAARRLLGERGDGRMVLGSAKALRYGSFVRPGEALRVEVTVEKVLEDGQVACKGSATAIRSAVFAASSGPEGISTGGSSGETAVSGRFTMRPIRMEPRQGAE